MEILKEKIKKIECIGSFEDEYVYDIGVNNDNPYFFGNDILVHNSVFFTVKPILETLKNSGVELNKDSFLGLSNSIGEEVNSSFPEFAKNNFNVSIDRAKVFGCKRETCSTRVLFIAKKRYACLMYDKEGVRLDKDGPGKLKIMGIETQRADTPKWVQEKLTEMILLTLDKNDEQVVLDFVTKFRKEFEELPEYLKGSPKRANNIKYYHEVMINKKGKDETGKTITIPGHVRAAINWNRIRENKHDYRTTKISDGAKIVVCKLKPNNYGITSIAYPIDSEHNLPIWFKELPFDQDLMLSTVIDKKVENIIGILGWNLNKTKENAVVTELFGWQ